MYRAEACVQRGDLSTKGRDLSTEGETRLWRVRLVYGGGGSSTECETLLQWRDILVYRGGDKSVEGENRLPRGRLVYTERETRLGTEICTFFTFFSLRRRLVSDSSNFIIHNFQQ